MKKTKNIIRAEENISTKSPLHLMLITLITIFVAEALIMVLLHYLPEFSPLATVFLDASLISIFILPALYYFMFKPMLNDYNIQKSAKETIRMYVDIVNNMQVGLHIYHLENPEDANSLMMVHVNPASAEFTGIPSEELIGNTIIENFPNLKETGTPNLYAKVALLESSEEIKEITYSDDRIEKSVYSIKVFPLPGRMVGVAFDNITERKKIEQALKDSKRKYKQLFKEMTSGFALHEIICNEKNEPVDYRFLEANPAFSEMTGLKYEDFIGKTVLEVLPNIEPEWIEKYGKVAITGESVKFENFSKELNKHYEVTAYSPQIGLFAVIFNDITTTKKLQEFTQRAQRLETAGRIAGQVAHDFNNLLGPLVAYPEFIRDELPEDHPALSYLNDMEKAAIRISEINQELLTLGRRGHYNLEPLNINEIITQTIKNIDIPKNIDLELNLDKDIMNIKGGSSQIFRAITNIVNNSLDAMKQNGNLKISTTNYYADAVTRKYHQIPRGDYVKITISDDGCGIDKEILPRILDPFFTTKSTDKKRGSGLGLSVVHAVIEDHNGFLDIESEAGIGTSFYIYFPIIMNQEKLFNSENVAGGTENILVVDDDKTQRMVSKKLLEKLGYKTESASSGEDAVKKISNKCPDLVILDMIMPPGIDGTETFRQMREIHPDVKAIIVSGYAESDRVNEALKLGAGGFVKKPLTIKSIAKAVRAELDRKVKKDEKPETDKYLMY